MNVDKGRLQSAADKKAIEPINRVYNIVSELMEQIKSNVIKELEDQGHTLTGSLIKSIDTKVGIYTNTVVGTLIMNDYGMAVETGVPAKNIPYEPTPPVRGGTSKYIEALKSFFTYKGLSEKAALSAAFATARVQKKEGIPTKNSYQFSSNGRRTGFMSYPLFEDKPTVTEVMRDIFDITINAFFNDIDYGKES